MKITKCAIFCFLFSTSIIGFCADTLLDVPIYVTGGFSEPSWEPGNGAVPNGAIEDLRLFDDGQSNGDIVADDGIWTCVVSGLEPFQEFDWKIASPGWSPVNVPDSAPTNLWAIADENGTVSFMFDTNFQNDGLLPDVGQPNSIGFAYSESTWDALQPIDTISLTGNFQTQLGGDIDWDFYNEESQILLRDDGNGFDQIEGDDIFTGSVTGLQNGTYEYRGIIEFDDVYFPEFTAIGLANAERNLKFNVLDSSEEIVFQLDAKKSRLGPIGDSSSPGPPFYAHSAAWGNSFTNTEDMGNALDLVYRKIFTVVEPNNYTVRIRDKSLKEYPVSGSYPFTTTEPNQEVQVVFDQNQYEDDYEPSSNIVFIVDNKTKSPLNQWEYVQLVGDCMIDFGGESDWNADDSGFEAFDQGIVSEGDQVADDGVFAIRIQTDATAANKQLKAVGRRLDMGDGQWDIQIGGPGEGLTINTTNTNIPFSYTPGEYTIQIDTLTGRVGVGSIPPERMSFEVSVGGWELH